MRGRKRKIEGKREQAILADVMVARHDLLELAKVHGVSVEVLAGWVDRPAVRKRLERLCLLADFQTQLLLSRYRTLAAGRLIKLATDQGEEGKDVSRKACVDLLRMDLKRTAGSDWEKAMMQKGEGGKEGEEGEVMTVQEMKEWRERLGVGGVAEDVGKGVAGEGEV